MRNIRVNLENSLVIGSVNSHQLAGCQFAANDKIASSEGYEVLTLKDGSVYSVSWLSYEIGTELPALAFKGITYYG